VIDSHTHLHLCEGPDTELVARAGHEGVSRMLTIGLDSASSRTALAAAERFPQVFAAVGRHPTNTHGFDDADLAELRSLADHERCVAVGETGFDFYREGAPRADQERAFLAHIELARETGKPLVVHCREAAEATLTLLAKHGDGVRVILHCFSMPDALERCLDQGAMISFAGNVTYPGSRDLADCVAAVPDDRLLVETDAPYLTPQVVRKHRNEPAFVAHTASFLAQRRGVELSALDALLEANAAALFGW